MSDARRPQRLHIGLFGRRNAGKSSLCNALCGQDAALVSPVPGTTTDPVEKVMELAPLGPVVLLDTPGLDDAGELGAQRVARSLRALEEVDVALVVLEDQRWGAPERELAALLQEADVPFGIVCNCRDDAAEQAARRLGPEAFALPASVPLAVCRLDGAATPAGALDGVREMLVRLRPPAEEPPLLRDLLPPRGRLILVCPQDGSAPKGRLIMPQVQAIRDALDGDALCLVVTDKALGAALDSLREPPQLIVCDSQVIAAVAAQRRRTCRSPPFPCSWPASRATSPCWRAARRPSTACGPATRSSSRKPAPIIRRPTTSAGSRSRACWRVWRVGNWTAACWPGVTGRIMPPPPGPAPWCIAAGARSAAAR